MALDNPLDRRKADAVTGELALVMQPLERPEQLVHVLLVEAGPVVTDEELHRITAELDPRVHRAAGEFPCVA